MMTEFSIVTIVGTIVTIVGYHFSQCKELDSEHSINDLCDHQPYMNKKTKKKNSLYQNSLKVCAEFCGCSLKALGRSSLLECWDVSRA